MTKPFKPTEAATYEDSPRVPMSKQQRFRLKAGDTDIRNTEHGDIWYTRGDTKALMGRDGKIITSYKVKGDARPTNTPGITPPKSDYDVLKAAGHSPMKALEIIVAAKREDPHALNWIDQARKQQQ